MITLKDTRSKRLNLKHKKMKLFSKTALVSMVFAQLFWSCNTEIKTDIATIKADLQSLDSNLTKLENKNDNPLNG